MRRPLIVLALSFVAGLGMQHICAMPAPIGWTLVIFSSLAALILFRFRLGGELRFFLWMLAFLGFGLARAPRPPALAVPEPLQEEAVVVGRIESARPTERGWRVDLRTESVRPLEGDPISVTVRARLLVLTPADGPVCPAFLPGDGLIARGHLHVARPFATPGQWVAVPDDDNPDWIGTIASCENLADRPSIASSGLGRWMEGLRQEVQASLRGPDVPGDERSAREIFVALSVGEQGGIPRATRSHFQRSGLAHILSISGLHLAIVAFGLYRGLLWLLLWVSWLARRFDLRPLAAGLTLPAIGFYTLLVGAEVPAVRSALMVGIFLMAVILRRQSDPLQTLSAAALFILAVDPAALFSISFQLSFLAVLALLVGVPRWCQMLGLPNAAELRALSRARRLRVRLVQSFLTSVIASLATAPLVAQTFHQVNVIGPLANLLAVPYSTLLIVPLGIAYAILEPIAPGLALWVGQAGVWLCDWFARFAAGTAAIPGSSFFVAGPNGLELILWFGLVAGLIAWGRFRRQGWMLLGLATALLLSVVIGWVRPLFRTELQVTFLDVGQGDAAVVRCPGGATWLIDTGPKTEGGFDAGERVVAPYLWSQGIITLDGIVISHPHPDHNGGLAALRERFSVRWLVESPEAWKETGRPNPCGFEFLHPGPADGDLEENDRSLVLKASAHGYSVLLLGDLQAAGEARLLERGRSLQADVLKVGHHGSAGGTSQSFVEAVRPKLAVISVGRDNPYHLPKSEVVENLQAVGAQVLRTDRDGSVRVELSPEGLRWSTYANGEWRDSNP